MRPIRWARPARIFPCCSIPSAASARACGSSIRGDDGAGSQTAHGNRGLARRAGASGGRFLASDGAERFARVGQPLSCAPHCSLRRRSDSTCRDLLRKLVRQRQCLGLDGRFCIRPLSLIARADGRDGQKLARAIVSADGVDHFEGTPVGEASCRAGLERPGRLSFEALQCGV